MYTVDEIKYMATISTLQSAIATPIRGFSTESGGWTIMCLYIPSPTGTEHDQYHWYIRQNLVPENEVQRVLNRAAV
jgi:hypothetical protein